MRRSDIPLAKEIELKLKEFSKTRSLPGVNKPVNLNCFIEQIVDSIRRIKYVQALLERELSPLCADPTNGLFDPLKAAVWHKKNGNIDESFWLIFLAIHFGKNGKTGWQLVREIYKGDDLHPWTWENISTNLDLFRTWLHENNDRIKRKGNFGNHRKYESLNAWKANGTGSAIASYVDWVGPARNHQLMINSLKELTDNARSLFQKLYSSMNTVVRFGRTGKFDYLTMIGKMGLVDIEPGSTYMQEATGPLEGAKLLFGGSKKATISKAVLNGYLIELDAHLNIYYGMQVLEDALCNWQKSPSQYIHFGG